MIRAPRPQAGAFKHLNAGHGGLAEVVAVVVLALALMGLYSIARHGGPLQVIEGKFLDWRFQARGPLAPSEAVAIVVIDDRTLAAIGRWPFSRRWLTHAMDALRTAGARTIAADLLLTGGEGGGRPAGASPALVAPDETEDPNRLAEDQALADAIGSQPRAVIPYAFTFERDAVPDRDLPESIRETAFRIVRKGAGTAREPVAAAGTLLPHSRFLERGHPAHVTVFYEEDGTIRFAHPVIRYRDDYYPSFPLEAARLYLGADQGEVTIHLGKWIGIGEHRVPLGGRQRLAINFIGPSRSFPQYSLIDVINGEIDASAFEGRIVLIGATATGLGDRFTTPFDVGLRGVELLASVIDNILEVRPLQHSGPVIGLDLLAIVVAALLALLLRFLRRPAAVLAGLAGLLAIWSLVNTYAFAEFSLWLNFTFPLMAMIMSAGIAVLGHVLREYRMRVLAENRTQALSHYVSPLTSVGLADPGGAPAHQRDHTAAVMFIDLVGYTAASEQMTMETSAAMLRRFHETVEHHCTVYGGMVDKYVGDGALLVFGFPNADPTDAANAIRCAQAIAAAPEAQGKSTGSQEKPAVGCSFGIHFGPVRLVELGGREHRQITVTGDTVNIASRLEAMTRDWQVQIVASGAVLAAARAAGHDDVTAGFECLPVNTVRGHSQTIEIWAWGSP